MRTLDRTEDDDNCCRGGRLRCHRSGRRSGRNLASRAFGRDSAVALLHHDPYREMGSLEIALESKAFYIGALGSDRTHSRRCNELRRRGFSDASIARINAPIGLFPKARDARSLALSILADVASRRMKSGDH
ncbi:XdhC family protein [Sinorhizobium meliloti]|uniref:XdhC family protein n=1 Tax=Rhizobium meliloti TaxID=382 RepID=UPI001F302CED|nr:XdhC family protein [Sinorhizobium meliloti]